MQQALQGNQRFKLYTHSIFGNAVPKDTPMRAQTPSGHAKRFLL
jgi:hypothetical protein